MAEIAKENTTNAYVLALDPSNIHTAYMLVSTEDMRPIEYGIVDNEWLIEYIRKLPKRFCIADLAIEGFQSFGMPVGRTVFDTCILIGRFYEAAREAVPAYRHIQYVYRTDEKLCICHTVNANDATIRQALKDIYGEVGTKQHKGFFYGVAKDVWSAFAVAHTYVSMLNGKYRKRDARAYVK